MLLALLDKNGNKIKAFKNTQIQCNKVFNSANPINFFIPSTEDIELLKLSTEFIIYNNREKILRGKIIRRDFSADPYYFQGLTSESYLENLFLPADYNLFLEGKDVGAIIPDLLYNYKSIIINTKEDYLTKQVDSFNLDLDFEQGKIFLAQDSGIDDLTQIPTKTFREQGHIIFQFDCGSHNGFDRLRWTQDIGEVVHIKISWRTSNDLINWDSWSLPLEIRSISESSDKYGINLRNYLFDNINRYIQVKVDLSTEDTETPLYDNWDDASYYNQQVYGFTPVFSGIELIYRVDSPISLAPDTPEIFGITARDVSSGKSLSVLNDLAEKYNLEFYVDPDLFLHVAPSPLSIADFDENKHLGRKTDIRLKETLNIDVDVLDEDDSGLINVLYCKGAGEGPAQLTITEPLIDEVSYLEYGERVDTFIDTSITDRTELYNAGMKYLASKSTPKQNFQVTIKEPIDIKLGDIVTVISPNTGLVTLARVLRINLEYRDVYTITVGLNTQLRNLLERLSYIDDSVVRKEERLQVIPPKPPAQFRASGYERFVNLSWWKGEADHYIIEHSKSGYAGPWETLIKVNDNNYTHSELELGSKHYYRIYAVKNNLISAPTDPISAVARDKIPPTKPVGVTASGIVGGINVTFTTPTEKDWDYSECHVSDIPSFTPSELTLKDSGKKTSFNIYNLEMKPYYAKIITVDYSGNRSEASNEVAATPEAIDITPPDGSITKDKLADGAITKEKTINGILQRAVTITVASSNSNQQSKDSADFICSGVADQVEINNAILALGDLGGSVLLLEGTYYLSDSIVIDKSNVVLSGVGNATEIRFNSSITTAFPAIEINGLSTHDIAINNLLINGVDENGEIILRLQNKYFLNATEAIYTPYGIYRNSAISNVEITNVSFYTIYNMPAIYMGGSTNKNIVISDNYFYNCFFYRSLVSPPPEHDADYIDGEGVIFFKGLDVGYIKNNYFGIAPQHLGTTFAHSLINLNTNISNTIVANNIFDRGLMPMNATFAHHSHIQVGNVQASSFVNSNIQISGNLINNGKVCLTNCTHTTFTNNVLWSPDNPLDNEGCLIILTTCKDIVISNNSFHVGIGYILHIACAGVGNRPNKNMNSNITIKNNVFKDYKINQYYNEGFIWITYSDSEIELRNIFISNNVFLGAGANYLSLKQTVPGLFSLNSFKVTHNITNNKTVKYDLDPNNPSTIVEQYNV